MRAEETSASGANATPAAVHARGCFICAFSDVICDTVSIEGTILRVEVPGKRDISPAVLLALPDGDEASILLPDHTRALVSALATLPGADLQSLRLRVVHLLCGSPHPTQARRQIFRTTPVSVAVLEPDLLLNITDINTAEYCVRQYPLRRMVPSPPNAATLRGTILHGAFKEMLKGVTEGSGESSAPSSPAALGTHEPDRVTGYLRRSIQTHLADLAIRQIAPDALEDEALPHMRALAAWFDRMQGSLWGSVPEIRAETFLLAPEVGLKGRMDFLLRDPRGGSLIELKTGMVHGDLPKREHRWQVHGYQTLLAAHRPHDPRRPGATLLYSGTPALAEGYGIPFAPRELHHVLDLRNQLALVHATGAVPVPPGARKCGRCALRQQCQRASHLLGWQPPEIGDVDANDRDPDLTKADAAAFAHFYALLRLEARATHEQARLLWQMPAAERQAAGIALGGLELAGEPERTPSGEWRYTFRCENTSELRAGDEVLLSNGDPVHGDVVSGTILELTASGVTLWTPERIAAPALIDRYGSEIVHDRTVRNLWRWLGVDARLRALVAGTQPPSFRATVSLDDLPTNFNAEQRQAVEQALAADDFLLVQGPPGTGKTRVVAEIARRAMARGERVLIAGFTNQAVDNVMLRLVAEGCVNIVRLGHELSVDPVLRAYRLAARAVVAGGGRVDAGHPDGALPPLAERLRETLLSAPIVAATCATWSAERYDGAGAPLRFDLAIIDEASQLTVPALLGALRFARRFVLVGDERQLPPLVVSEEAANRGLKQSLFSLLLARWGDAAAISLVRQYRMHPVICGFSSAEFYGGALVADGAARTALLDVALAPDEPLHLILDPARPVVFVDVAGRDEPPGKASAAQAEVARRLVMRLHEGGVSAEQIGVIAPYRAQVAAIRQRLAARGEMKVTVDTVDRFQGGEREVIVFACGGRVPSHPQRRGIEFLADPHRLNVALTRVQRKLIVLGDREALAVVPIFSRLIAYCARLYGGRGGIVTAHRAG